MRWLLALALSLNLAAACARTTPPTETAMPAPLMTWPDLLNRPRPAPTRTVAFGPAPTDVADLWLPDGAGPFPVVLMVHGGCWQKEVADRTIMNWAAEVLRADGIAVWNIEYRGVDEAGGGYPGTFVDVARAADALRDNGAQYRLKTDRVVAFGHSAGGHLALWLAARPRLPASSKLAGANPLPIAGVVVSGGLADLKASAPVTEASCLADILDKLTGPPGAGRADVFADTSPAELLPLGVAQVSVNGDSDRIAPALLGEGLTARARAAGDPAEAVVVSHTGHVELIAPGTAAFAVEVARIRALLGLPAKAT